MSTRCNIIIKKENDSNNIIYVYHHCDGYPEGVGEELKNIISNHYTEAFINPSSIEQLLYEYSGSYGAYEETDNIHGDIEYLYILTVMDDLRVKYQCIDVPLMEDYNYKTLENCTLIEECFLTPDDLTETNKEQTYPTFDQALSFTINNFSYKDISKEDIESIIRTFYNYINTPLNNSELKNKEKMSFWDYIETLEKNSDEWRIVMDLGTKYHKEGKNPDEYLQEIIQEVNDK